MGGWIQGQALFVSHGKTNSCGVLISYYGTKKIEVINKKCDYYRRILLLEINIDDRRFVLINIYNANKELDQVKLSLTLAKFLTVSMIFKIKI